MTAQDEQAFLDAIRANPDDDTPRLVFADWLDERGQGDDADRAALIRAQCQIAHLPKGGKARRELEKQAKDFLAKHGEWAQPLDDAGVTSGWAFRRGFLEFVEMGATDFADSAEDLFEAAPMVCAARFPDASNEVEDLAECEHLARLSSLDISRMCSCGFCPIQNDLKALFKSKFTARLTKLNVSGNRMTATGVRQLAASKALTNLTELDLSDNPLGADAGMRALGKAKNLKKLVSLDLSYTDLYTVGAIALAELKTLPALARLSLRGNLITADGVESLTAWPQFFGLTHLDLADNPIGARGAKALAKAPATAKLALLNVRDCGLSESSAAALKKRYGKAVKV